MSKVTANNDEVICPNCVTQFRAIPVNVQEELIALRAELERLTTCLKKANDQAEEFERKWYLSMDELEQERTDYKSKCAELELVHEALDATKKDARRYRWLREPDNERAADYLDQFSGDDLDAALDSILRNEVAE